MSEHGSARLPLSAAQTGVWVGQQLAPDSPLYNCGTYLEISGRIDAALLTEAVRRTVAETEALRVRFTEDADGVWQIVEPPGDVPVPVLDVSGAPDPQATARAWMADDLATPTDPRTGPLYTHALLRTARERSLLYFRHHHIALDGYAQSVYCARLAQIYTALAAGQEPRPARFRPLAELLDEDRAYRTSARHDEDRTHWHDTFADHPEPASLTGRAAAPGPALARRTVRLSGEQGSRLAHAGRWPAVLVAAVAAYVHRLTAAPDVVVGLPLTGRTTALALSTPAMLANELPLRFSVTGRTTLAGLVRQATDQIAGALRHQRYRGEDLRHHLNLSGATGGLHSVTVNAMSFGQKIRFGDHETTVRPLSTGPVHDLHVASYGDPATSGDGVQLEFGGNPALYAERELAAHQDRFVAFLDDLVADPAAPVGSVDLFGAGERRRVLVEWNDTAAEVVPGTLPELFEAQVVRTPDAVAVVAGDVGVSYAELDARANRLAHHLVGRGVGPESVVGVCLERGVELVVALLAVMKAGGAYLPIDPDFPAERIDFMLRDAGPVAVVTSVACDGPVFEGTARIVLDDPSTVAALTASETTAVGRSLR
ncbi:AMP-binding protein, partial [Streptomyces sp. SID7499]|nr:AMP-binding protein [Streptomyces sp. SID7499]